MNTMKILKVDNETAEKIHYAPFQRKINPSRIASIIKYVHKGGFIPPILLGEKGQDLLLIDGQHRLEAWKRKKYNLYANLQPGITFKEASQEFVDISSYSVRISLKHRLKHDQSPMARMIRNYAEYFKCEITQVYAIFSGLNFNMKSTVKVKKILRYWRNDKRWGIKNSIYSKPGTLKMIGSLTRTTANLDLLMERLSKIDYSKKSPLSLRYGSSGTTQRMMKEYCLKYII